jgi:hypothetical protein
MMCGYRLKSIPGMVLRFPPLCPDCTTSSGMSGRRDPSMSASLAKRNTPLCGAGLTNVTNARESTGATTVDQSIGGSIGVLNRPTLSRYTALRYRLHVKTWSTSAKYSGS